MKKITQYKSDDGLIFNSGEECLKYESILKEVNDFLKQFPNPDDYDLSGGKGYIQHKPGTYAIMEDKLVELSNKYLIWDEKFTKFGYYLGRVLDDSGIKCLNRLSYRLMCIKDDKEYDQPYFATNSHLATNVQVN